MDIFKIIERPLYSERTTAMTEKENRYVFKVAKNATKNDIKQAIEKLFNVTVQKVNTAVYLGKKRRMGAHEGIRPTWKKAMIRLKKGQTIKPIDQQA